MRKTLLTKVLVVIRLLLLPSSLLFVFASFLPYRSIKMIGDLLSKDGNLSSFTPDLMIAFRLSTGILGAFLLTLTCLLFFKRVWIENKIIQGGKKINDYWINLLKDIKYGFQDISAVLPKGFEIWIMVVITAGAILLRTIMVDYPIEYDEAYTYNEFARHPFFQMISDYHVVNNHVFHTILVKVSTALFGNSPSAIRLPVFVAGILVVLAGYFLAKALYGSIAGINAAAFLAFLPLTMVKSVNARGYTLVCLFTLMSLVISTYLVKHNNRFAWLLWTVMIALGFYTVPTMLYPFALIFTWLLIEGILNRELAEYSDRRKWVKCVFGYTFLAGVLSIFLYLPIFLNYGFFDSF